MWSAYLEDFHYSTLLSDSKVETSLAKTIISFRTWELLVHHSLDRLYCIPTVYSQTLMSLCFNPPKAAQVCCTPCVHFHQTESHVCPSGLQTVSDLVRVRGSQVKLWQPVSCLFMDVNDYTDVTF